MIRSGVSDLPRAMLVLAFQDWFGLQSVPATVLLALFEAGGDPVARSQLRWSVNRHRQLSTEYLQVIVNSIRQAMEVEAIDTAGGGYQLTDVGMDECREALRKVAASIQAAAA